MNDKLSLISCIVPATIVCM